MSAETNRTRRTWTGQLAHWVAELLLVFLGAYAAFWLSGYQQRQQDLQRRDQILASLEDYVQEIVVQSEHNAVSQEEHAAAFERAVAAGEMPPVRPITWTTDYSPTDTATFLQGGGLNLLDVKTLNAMRQADSVTRELLSKASHDEKLSDELIYPNLGKGAEFFYNLETKQLKEPFTAYPKTLRSYVEYFQRMAKSYKELLDQIRAERKRK
jgi:phosphodiesterase/alkaline phosphatase D-like protein